MSALFSKKRTSLKRLLQDKSCKTTQDSRPSNFFPNSKRLGGYTHRVHFFLQKSARHQGDLFKTHYFKTSRYIRVLFYKEPGILGYSSAKDQSNFKTRPSSYFFQIARGSGATPSWMCFFLKRHIPLEDPRKRYMVLLKKALGRRLFLLGKT